METVRRALISVSDKTGIVEFARELAALDVEILSTGGTARQLTDAGIAVTEVSDHTGFPEMMDGRVKTLHPKIHGGLLGRRDQDVEVMQEHSIPPIDMVVVNLYPFEQAVADPGCTLPHAIENIDIGGPAMLRSAAKNHASVTVIVDVRDYARVLDELRSNDGAVGDELRFDLATKVFEHTARYDGAIANYLGGRANGDDPRFPRSLNLQYNRVQPMRYGENPHQDAAFYRERVVGEACIAGATLVQGKALSYNNVADADAALECVKAFTERPACVIVKHANPCGVALGADLAEAYDRAFKTDPTSAFGGIIAFNRELDVALVTDILERQFVEVIIAPSVSDDAKVALAAKKNVRVLETGAWAGEDAAALDFKRVAGGLLVQDKDRGRVDADQVEVVTEKQPSPAMLADLLFAWRVAKFVKSNAIVYCKDGATVGIGAGQMSRVYSARIAAIKAADEGLVVPGSVMASDAFFPFRDGIDSAAEVGIEAVIQPGGSVRDNEVIAAANEHGMAMVFTRMRHFRH